MRVLRPPRGAVDPPPRLEEARQERAVPETGDVELDVPGLGGQQPGPPPVAVRRALVGALVPPGADRLGHLELNQLLEHERHRVAQDVGAVARADGVEQPGQGSECLIPLPATISANRQAARPPDSDRPSPH